MRVVLVSSPGDPAGAPPAGHWSHATAVELGRVLLVAGASVEWFRVSHPVNDLPAPPPGVQLHALRVRAEPLHRVAAASADLPLEIALTRSLRERHADCVVHVGAGARGSMNVPWIADRMGCVPYAVVRAAEVVCHRGTLIDADNRPCSVFDDPQRCRDCCARSWSKRPRAAHFADRTDLLVGSLVLAAGVFVPTPIDAERLLDLGIGKRALVVAREASEIAPRITGVDTVTTRTE